MASVSFASEQEGWVLGGPASCTGPACAIFRHTSDGGHTWHTAPAPAVRIQPDNDIEYGTVIFTDPLHGWVYDRHHLWSTRDGGVSWVPRAMPALMIDTYGHAVTFANSADGWATDSHTLWSSHDGGTTWQAVDLGRLGHIALAVSDRTVWVAGLGPDSGLHLASSPVGTDSWSQTTLFAGMPTGGPSAVPLLAGQDGAGWVVLAGRGDLGGARLSGGIWSLWQTPPCGDNGTADLKAMSATNLLALCGRGGPYENEPAGERLLTSTDGGTHFEETGPIWPGTVPARFLGGANANSLVAILRTADGLRLRTSTDGGHIWLTTYTGTQDSYFLDGRFVSPAFGYATQADGNTDAMAPARLIVTRDGGRTWTATTPNG